MGDGVSVFRRLAGQTFLTCVRGLIQAVVAMAGRARSCRVSLYFE